MPLFEDIDSVCLRGEKVDSCDPIGVDKGVDAADSVSSHLREIITAGGSSGERCCRGWNAADVGDLLGTLSAIVPFNRHQS